MFTSEMFASWSSEMFTNKLVESEILASYKLVD